MAHVQLMFSPYGDFTVTLASLVDALVPRVRLLYTGVAWGSGTEMQTQGLPWRRSGILVGLCPSSHFYFP